MNRPAMMMEMVKLVAGSDDNNSGGFSAGDNNGGFPIEQSNNGGTTENEEGGFELAEENGGFMVETEEILDSKASKDHDVPMAENDNDGGFPQDTQDTHDANSGDEGGFLVDDDAPKQGNVEDIDEEVEIMGEHKFKPQEAPYKDIQSEFEPDELPQKQNEEDDDDDEDQEENDISILADPRNYMNLDDDNDLAYDSSNITRTEKPSDGIFQLTVVPGPSSASASTKSTTRASLAEIPKVPKQGTSRDDPAFCKDHGDDHDDGVEKGEDNVSDSEVADEPEEESDGDDDGNGDDDMDVEEEDGEEYEFEYSDSE
ncbi:unnamed protein product [Ambrosiozyma monospora]|uniref:Unnamed protein product n=1 Tax=Ambrosiozyma monospora TaxID=43982 RepID=A0ACB5T3G9_AMBMO|nr:unnamed protein product [Ambrosiozyma monospora]